MREMSISHISINCMCVYKFLNYSKEGLVLNKKAILYKIMYVEEGAMDIFVNDRKYSLFVGDLFFMPANTIYNTDTHGKTIVLYNVLFSFYKINDEFNDDLKYAIYSKSDKKIRVNFSDFKDFNDCKLYKAINFSNEFINLEKEYFKREKLSIIKTNSILTDIIIRLMEENTQKRSNELYKKVIEYINDNISNDISCESVATRFHYHPNYVNKLVRTNVGMSLHTYLMESKCKYAAKLLLTTNKSITDIAQDLFFCDGCHFTNVFKKVIGCTPSEYRKNYM